MLTEAKLRRICTRADTGRVLLQQLPKTCQWADILRTSVKHLETAHRVMGLEFCPGAIFTGPEGNGRHTHANALANNLVEKADYRSAISIHGSDLAFQDPDDIFDLLDFLEKIAMGSGKSVLLLDQLELSDHSIRFQNQLLRMQQSLLANGTSLFLILIAGSAEDVAPTLLSRFPRYHCPAPNSEAITAFVEDMLTNPVPIPMEKGVKAGIAPALKNCSWKQLKDLHTQLLRMIVIHYQLNFRKYKESGLTEEQVYQDGHIQLSAKAVKLVLHCVTSQNPLPVMPIPTMPMSMMPGVTYAGAPVTVDTGSESVAADVDEGSEITNTILSSDDPVKAFLDLIGPVPEDEEET